MGSPPCAALRHPPPLLTFLACLLTLAATFLSYAAYIRASAVSDADFSQDLDTVLQTLSGRRICPPRNGSGPATPLQSDGLPVGAGQEDLATMSALTSVTLTPWRPSANHSGLRIRATAGQLGMKGPGADSPLLITVTSSWWSTQCNDSDADCSRKYCVIVSSPQSALPQSWSSFRCSAANPSRQQLEPEVYVVEDDVSLTPKCYRLQYSGDPTLKAMISQEDRALASRHLQAAMLVCLLVTFLLFVVSALWIFPTKDKRTPGRSDCSCHQICIAYSH